ncbi:MAG: hypothetical protein DYG97_10175 [Ignavibacteria bacterium CHB3]|nr:hypothetical protein [Ignavibacteria bacterium CHB3]
MGNKINIKEITEPRLLSDVTSDAQKKFPGLNKITSIIQYNLLVKEIFRVKRQKHLKADILLTDLLINAYNYYWKEGRN